VFGNNNAGAAPFALNCRTNNFAPAQTNLNDGATAYHHFAWTFDGVNTTWYVDNVQILQTTDGNHMGFGPNNPAITFGASKPVGAATNFFKGRLQDIAFYKVALTAAQIAAHWNAITNPGASSWKKFQQI
jgi:hypothetical protein